MTDYVGDVVGAARSATQSTPLVPLALAGGSDRVLIRDTIEVVTAFAQNDRVLLGYLPSKAVINPVSSVIWFDDMGTSITMDVGDATTENALVAAQDVATAAGSCLFYKSVDVAKFCQPLWQVLGLSADPVKPIAIYAKLEGGDPGAGTITWQIMGQERL